MTADRPEKSQKGFTLIEVMIAMTIMAALTIFTTQSIRSALRNSTKYRKQIDNTSELRSVIRVIERDINLAFHHRSIQIEVLNQLSEEGKSQNGGNGVANPSGSPTPTPTPSSSGSGGNNGSNNNSGLAKLEKREVPNYTRFLGEPNSLHFTTLNHSRTIEDVQESDQAEVGYFLKSCSARGNKKQKSQCLWRRLSPILDDEVEKGGGELVMLENVKSLKLSYLAPPPENELNPEPEWLDRWDSQSERDVRSKGKFPEAVKIELTVTRKNGTKDIDQTVATTAALRFPNNPTPTPTPSAATNGNNGGSGSGSGSSDENKEDN